ncbi:transposase [Mycobacterium sp. URHB0021]
MRMVRALRAELGTDQGAVSRVARQLGYGVESVRSWVRQADIDDGYSPGVSHRGIPAHQISGAGEPRTQAHQ